MSGRRLALAALSICLVVPSLAGSPPGALADESAGSRAGGSLETGFRQPGDEAKPWAYWWWLKGNVTRDAITRDLEAMKRVGFGGLLHFDARGYHEGHVPPPESRMEFMSPEWRRMLRFGIAEARRLGLQVSVNLSSCAGALKGPWAVGSDAPKQLVWTSHGVRGPRRLDCTLHRPAQAHFSDVALLAIREEEGDKPPAPDAKAAETVDLSSGWRSADGKLGAGPPATEVLDLTGRVDAQGRVVWDVPRGSWRLIRFAWDTMAGHEYDVDILSAKAVEGHFDRMGGAILADAGPDVGKSLTHFYSVSWEGAAPTWTLGLEDEFHRLRAYRMRTYLPVLAGVAVRSRDESLRFLRDYHATLGELFRDNFYGTLRRRCHQAGLQWHSESGGPWNRKLPTFAHADQLAFLARNDMPQGEFWFRGQALNRPIAMAAHVYGRRLAAVEAFTHMRQHWSAYPAGLKPGADAAFCDGVNHFVWHTFTCSLPEFGLPGSEYFAGTHINPNVTWFDQAGPFVRYLAGCQLMLRQGRFVGDVCCYVGDNAYLHWGRGANWSERPTLALDKGYSYDLVNTEVLLERLSVRDGDLVLPDGMRYRLMVVDLVDLTALPQALGKIRELAEAGATVVLGSRCPTRAPGLTDYPACDDQVRRLAAELWGEGREKGAGTFCATTNAARRCPPPGRSGKRRLSPFPLGRGQIFTGTPLADVLKTRGLLPDFEGPFDYTHRHAEGMDVYFLAGEGRAECTFRARGREPEFWDPQTGQARPAMVWRTTNDGRTMLPVQLPKAGSIFVVFRRPAASDHLVSVSGPEDGLEFGTCSGDSIGVRLWRSGLYVLHTSHQRQIELQAPAIPTPITLSGPWALRFQPGRGAPDSAVFDDLTPWDKHPDPRIKFFSGRATYLSTFTLSDDLARRPVRLDLGDVKYLAQVRLNGRDLGVVWTDPWSVDLTGAVRPGENQLEIDVVNLWVNRVIGDAGLPPEKRLTKTNVALYGGKRPLRPYQGFCSESPLLPSGLLGPVRLEFGQDRTVHR